MFSPTWKSVVGFSRHVNPSHGILVICAWSKVCYVDISASRVEGDPLLKFINTELNFTDICILSLFQMLAYADMVLYRVSLKDFLLFSQFRTNEFYWVRTFYGVSKGSKLCLHQSFNNDEDANSAFEQILLRMQQSSFSKMDN